MAPKRKGPPRDAKGRRIHVGSGNSGGSSQAGGSSQVVGSSQSVGSAHSGGGSAHSGGGSAHSGDGSAQSGGGSAQSGGGSAHSGGAAEAGVYTRSKELTWLEDTIKQKNDEIKDAELDSGKVDVDVHQLVKEIENYRRAVEDPVADRLRSSSEAGSPSK